MQKVPCFLRFHVLAAKVLVSNQLLQATSLNAVPRAVPMSNAGITNINNSKRQAEMSHLRP
jgi:hypothetical protein